MIRFLRLFLWLRLKLFVGHLKEAKAKGRLSQLGAVLSVVAIGFVGVLLAVMAVAFAVMAFAGGETLLERDAYARSGVLMSLRILFFVLLGLLLVMPAVRAGRGSFGKGSGGLTRLLLLPLSRRHLHASEVFANALDPFILAFVPALMTLASVLALRVGGLGAVIVVAAGALMILALMAWAALLGIALQLLFRDRKRAELALLVIFMVWIGLSVVPTMIEGHQKIERKRATEAQAEQQVPAPEVPLAPVQEPETTEEKKERERAERIALAETFPVWLQWLPSESFARTLHLVSRGSPVGALPSLLSLAAFVAACWWSSLRLWERLIGSPESSSTREVVDVSKMRLRGLPGVPTETAGVAYATMHSFLRTVRGKLAIAMTPLMVALFGFMMSQGKELAPEVGFLSMFVRSLGPFAIVMSLLSLLPVLANAFACDRAGFTLQALTPLPPRVLVWGKVWGCLLVYLICLVLSLAAVFVIDRAATIASLLDTFLVGLGAFMLSAVVGLWLSVLFPRHSDLSALGNEGNPHYVAQLVGMVAMGLVLGLGLLGSWAGMALFGESWGGLVGSAAFVALSCLVSWPLLEGAAGALEKRWETVVLTAQGR